MRTLAMALVLAAIGIVAVAVWPISRLLRELPRGSMRLEWMVLPGMVGFFILGYLGYLVYFTGLQNRRDFDRHWQAEMGRARRFGLPLALLVIDVDHFKGVNDTFGHTVGDQVLASVGHAIKAVRRETDFPARYGGEEFAMAGAHRAH